jgi:hypothetical protein
MAEVGAVAQLGERLVCNQEATGSIPVSSTRFCRWSLVVGRESLAKSQGRIVRNQSNVGHQPSEVSEVDLEHWVGRS